MTRSSSSTSTTRRSTPRRSYGILICRLVASRAVQITQGSYSLALLLSEDAIESPLMAIHPTGAGLTQCDATNIAQRMSFTGASALAWLHVIGAGNAITPGLLQTPQGICISGRCDDHELGCSPLHVAECDASDADQLFFYFNNNGSFVNAKNHMCLGLLAGIVCLLFCPCVRLIA